jgi:hypothetical protein
MTDTIPYTHWAYFHDMDLAVRCADELFVWGFLCGVDENKPPTPEEDAEFRADLLRQAENHDHEPTRQALLRMANDTEPAPQYEYGWLLRAAHECELGDCHDKVRAIVERHGGFYDYGESGWLDMHTGEPIRQADPPPSR